MVSGSTEVSPADAKFGYELAYLPPGAFADLGVAAEALQAARWQVSVEAGVLSATSAEIDARVAIDSADLVLWGHASSRWLLATTTTDRGRTSEIRLAITASRRLYS